MGKRGKRKKDSNESGSDSCTQSRKKVNNERGPSGGDFSVSELLNQTNSILYENGNDSVFVPNLPTTTTTTTPIINRLTNMATGNSENPMSVSPREPSLTDVMKCLNNIEGRLSHMDKRLDGLEEVKKKVDVFDREIKKLWLALEDKNKKVTERVVAVEEKVESTDFALGMLSDKVVTLEKERNLLKDEVTYLQSQSMRSNLLFSNIPEVSPGVNEDAEAVIKVFLVEKMKVAKEAVDQMVMERVHRIGPKQQGRCRKIVAKFLQFKDKEFIRKQWKALEGTPFYVSEQFPREVVEQRKRLVPKLRAARQEGKQAWIAYDTLYVDGRAMRV